MRSNTLAIACALFLAGLPAFAQTPPLLEASAAAALAPMGLQDALNRAALASPTLRAKQAQLAAAEGARTDAGALLFNNPQLSIEGTRRQLPQSGTAEQRYRESSIGISQAFEIAGQAGYRREASQEALDALRFEVADIQRQVRSDISSRFYRVLTLQQRVEVETQALQLFDSAAAAVQKRRAAGEDTRLDANVALVEAERARNQLALAQEVLLEARSELAARLQLAGTALPSVQGDPMPAGISYSLGSLLDNLDTQPRLLALTKRERSANARLQLEQAAVYPDVTVGLNVGREGPGSARERLTTLSVALPLPLFKRNATAIGQATTEASQAQIERQTALRDSRANVTALWSKLYSQEQRVRRLQETVLPALTDNQTLAGKSRQAGQIGLLELIVINRQALDARRDLIEALNEYHTTRAALELAAGWPREGNQP